MKMKKLTSALLACMLVSGIALTGCGNSDEGNTASKGGEGEASKAEGNAPAAADKIILFQSKVEIVDQLEALAEEYKAETNVEVEVWGTTGDDYFQQLKTKLANNQGPTVFSLAPGAESTQMTSYLADLSDLSFVSKLYEGTAAVIDGKTVGIPYTAEGFGLLYNKSMVDPSKIATTDDLISFLKTQKDAGVNGLGLSSESYFLIGHMLNTPFALQENPTEFVQKVVSGEAKMAETPAFQDFAKLYAGIRENCTNPLEVNYDKEIGDFATKKSAMIHQGNWAISMFNDYEMDFEMGFAPLPLTGNDKIASSVPTAWFLNSQAAVEEQQAGKDFLEWLYTSETGTKYLMDEFKFIPVVEGMENKNMDALSQEISNYIAEGKTISWPMNDWPAGIVDTYIVPIAQEFFTTDLSEQAFLEKLDAAFVEAGKK